MLQSINRLLIVAVQLCICRHGQQHSRLDPQCCGDSGLLLVGPHSWPERGSCRSLACTTAKRRPLQVSTQISCCFPATVGVFEMLFFTVTCLRYSIKEARACNLAIHADLYRLVKQQSESITRHLYQGTSSESCKAYIAPRRQSKEISVPLLERADNILIFYAILLFRCFAIGLSGAMSRLGAACNDTDPTASISAALNALPGLGLSVATNNPFGSVLWGYNLSSFLIQVHIHTLPPFKCTDACLKCKLCAY